MIIIEFKHGTNKSVVKTFKRTVKDAFGAVSLMKSLGFSVTKFKVVDNFLM